MGSHRIPACCTTIWIDVGYELKTVTRWTTGAVIFCLEHIIHVWNSLPQDIEKTKIRFKKWDYLFVAFFSEVTNMTFFKIPFTKLETP